MTILMFGNGIEQHTLELNSDVTEEAAILNLLRDTNAVTMNEVRFIRLLAKTTGNMGELNPDRSFCITLSDLTDDTVDEVFGILVE